MTTSTLHPDNKKAVEHRVINKLFRRLIVFSLFFLSSRSLTASISALPG